MVCGSPIGFFVSVLRSYTMRRVNRRRFGAVILETFVIPICSLAGAPSGYRPRTAFFVRRRMVSASSNSCLLYSCKARYFPDSSCVASSTTSPLRS
jgi:hypothetical protein